MCLGFFFCFFFILLAGIYTQTCINEFLGVVVFCYKIIKKIKKKALNARDHHPNGCVECQSRDELVYEFVWPTTSSQKATSLYVTSTAVYNVKKKTERTGIFCLSLFSLLPLLSLSSALFLSVSSFFFPSFFFGRVNFSLLVSFRFFVSFFVFDHKK